MEKLNEVLIKIRMYFLVIVIAVLLVINYFKSNTIQKQKDLLAEKPRVEYIPQIIRDTITDSIPTPVEIIKWLPGEVVEVPVEVEKYIELSNADSAQISEAYTRLYGKYAEIKKYDEVLKDDSTGYVRLKETVQYNSIFDRELTFENRQKVVYITQPTKVYMSSIVGGIEAGPQGFKVGAGFISRKNAFYKGAYDPNLNTWEAGVYLPIFNFKKR